MTTPDRRQFIRGHWIPQSTRLPSPEGTFEIASILVQAAPARLDAVVEQIEAIDGAEIFERDERGKLVVVLEAANAHSLGGIMTAISVLPHVISAALVYHVRETPDPQTEITVS